jgi:UrcA family protein
MTAHIIKTGLLALSLFGLLVVGSSQARANSTTRAVPPGTSITVRFADLNIDSADGAWVLYSRIRGAAETVCGVRTSAWEGDREWVWRECYRATVDEAVRRINRPMLTGLHASFVRTPSG